MKFPICKLEKCECVLDPLLDHLSKFAETPYPDSGEEAERD